MFQKDYRFITMQFTERLKTIKDIPQSFLKNKRVLLRADLNVPIDKNGIISDKEDWRIKAVLPTIEYLLKKDAKIILITHLGRPKGVIVESLRLGPIQDKLSALLDISVGRMPDCLGRNIEKAVQEMEAGEILMLENLRFHKEEEENDEEFAKKLASLGEIYVNDAFSDSHRSHASIVGIPKFLPAYAGLLMEKEIKILEKAKNPSHPAIAIIGGIKLETKLPLVKALSKLYDNVLVGGMIANQIINSEFTRTISPNVILPILDGLSKQKYFDIGADSVKEFSKFINEAKSIIWNGPMGKFEDPDYEIGTKGIIAAIKSARRNGAEILIGGGETIYALQKFAPALTKNAKRIYISTGGGAMLEFLAGKELPGIEALKSQS